MNGQERKPERSETIACLLETRLLGQGENDGKGKGTPKDRSML